MKKSLIALAVLAAAGAASAQSSVTLYGQVDAFAGSAKNTLSNVATPYGSGISQSVVGSSGLYNSRWGLKGSEDLGGGLKADFVLESGFNTDDGAASLGSTFERKATVGVAGAFGTVTLGRDYTPYFTIRSQTNHVADSNVAVTNAVWGYSTPAASTASLTNYGSATNGDYNPRVSNSVRFDSATYNGFSGSLGYAFAEDKTATMSAKDKVSFNVKYAQGPLLVGFANQTEKAGTGPSTKYNLIGASYDLGVAKVTGAINNVNRPASAAGVKDESEYQFGVSAPFGATTLYAGYAGSTTKNTAGAKLEERKGYDLSATYALSARTRAYAAYMNVDVKNTTRELSIFALGVHHSF